MNFPVPKVSLTKKSHQKNNNTTRDSPKDQEQLRDQPLVGFRRGFFWNGPRVWAVAFIFFVVPLRKNLKRSLLKNGARLEVIVFFWEVKKDAVIFFV